MEQYMRMKMEERDFHAVADAAMDLRELEALLKNKPKYIVPQGRGLT